MALVPSQGFCDINIFLTSKNISNKSTHKVPEAFKENEGVLLEVCGAPDAWMGPGSQQVFIEAYIPKDLKHRHS